MNTAQSQRVSLFGSVCAGLALLGLVSAGAAVAQEFPARPVPPKYWPSSETLRPVDPDPLPALRDNTRFQDNRDGSPKGGTINHPDIWPFWQAVDAEGGFLYTGLSHGLQVWDPRSNPEDPALVSQTDFRAWRRYCAQFEIQHVLQDLEVPDGDASVAAVTGTCSVGTAIFDMSNRSAPRLLYQDDEYNAGDVYAVRIGTTSYAYVSADQGLRLYNLNRAKQFDECLTTAEGCPGVHLNTLRSNQQVRAVNGVDQFMAVALGRDGVEIWNISNPTSPAVKLTGEFSQILNGDTRPITVSAVEMWQAGGDYHLALVQEPFVSGQGVVPTLQVFNVDCIRNAGSCSLGNPLQRIRLHNGTVSSSLALGSGIPILTISRSNGVPFLYVGSTNRFSGGAQREWLLNVATPNVLIEDVTPPTRIFEEGVETGYWGWYYRGNPTGFRNVAPRQGIFLDDYFYRAGFAIFDIHKRLGGTAPVADFEVTSLESDGRIYPGAPGVRFEDRSGGAPDDWSWSFEDGSPSLLFGVSTADVEFDSPGNKEVTLISSNDVGDSDPFTDTVTVLAPEPAVAGVGSNVQTATECQTITLTAEDPVGKPPLAFAWRILNDSAQEQVGEAISGGQMATWEVSQGLSGTFTAEVTVSNDPQTSSTAMVQSGPITINRLDPLPQPGFLIDDPIVTNGVVEFHVDAPGATEWLWDFGDGTTPEWTSDPVNGPSPVHEYAEAGAYQVTVEVRSCKGGPVQSAALEVVVESVVDLQAEFEASNLQCNAVFCAADEDQTITFEDRSTGAQVWEYDWDGDGTFEESSTSGPIASHVYSSAGNFRPVLKVSRRDGAETDTFEHRVITVESDAPPPPTPTIRVTGPRTGEPGVQYTFAASCSGASSTGWSWSTSGGAVAGSSSGSTIRVSWSSTGTKTVTANHSGCNSGFTRITISDPGNPGDPGDPGADLNALFNFSPSQPQAGQAVTFDGSASEGSPEAYIWDFGDDTSTVTGVEVQHTFAEAGRYEVLLTVSRAGSGSGCRLGVCIDELTKTVVVGGGGPEPEPEPEPTPGAVCPDDPNAFCLLDGRFKVEVDWRNHHDGGTTGIGKPVTPTPLADQDTTGFYWFFNPFNTELIVKVIDGRDVNGNFWFFYGALTDVEYTITVTDQDTGVMQEYHNEPNNVCGQGDVQAFPVPPETPEGLSAWRIASFDAIHQTGDPDGEDEPDEPENEPNEPQDEPETSGACQAGPNTLCLLDGRFEVGVHFKDQINDQEGDGVAIPGTDQTGYFWFFSPSNVELVVKAIDGTSFNDRFWFFYGALSTVEYDIVVTDTETGAQNVYHNDPDNICGQADTVAFEP